MERKDFLKNGLIGLSSIIAAPTILTACTKDNISTSTGNCTVSPSETKGPFPIKTPSQLVMANIKSDRTGLALLINLTIQNKNNNCNGLAGALVDVWHCDKDGNYSEYSDAGLQGTDFSAVHFLRGRQAADANGKVSFLTIYPGWYPGRAPHIHLEILSSTGSSLLVTQIAFPENISGEVYSSPFYSANGQADTKNSVDNVFADSLVNEIGTVTGNVTDGYTLEKTIVVNG
jgi:protocatechuate 3,4-dioxygenase beta subunit